MPNPFMKLGTTVQSKTSVDRPEAIAPVLEHYEGNNHPFRGTEDHGVADTVKPHDPETYGVDPDHPSGEYFVPLEDDLKDPEPIPVRIVTGDDSKKELRTFDSGRLTLADAIGNPANVPQQIVGRKEGRINVRITNLDAVKQVYIGRHASETAMFGYPLLAGKELVLATEVAVWATSADGTPVNIAFLVEYPLREE